MTKIRNTKKGMAKKTLSISLAVAMLATSNVPVWAAEDLFTDGEVAVEAFTSDVEEAPVAEVEESVVEEEVEAPVATTAFTEDGVVVELSVTNTSMIWAKKDADDDVNGLANPTTADKTATVTGTVTTPDGAAVACTYRWKDESGEVLYSTTNLASTAFSATSALAGKTLSLYIDGTVGDNEFDIDTKIKVKINKRALSVMEPYADPSYRYTGETQTAKVADFSICDETYVPGNVDSVVDAAAVDFSATTGINAGDVINVTATALPGSPYTGTVSKQITIGRAIVDDFTNFIVGTKEGLTFNYTGNEISVPVEGNVTLKEKDFAKADLTTAIKKAYIAASEGVGDAIVSVDVDGSALTNYRENPNGSGKTFLSDFTAYSEVTAAKVNPRDLSTTGTKITVNTLSGNIPTNTWPADILEYYLSFTGTENVSLNLKNDVDISVTDMNGTPVNSGYQNGGQYKIVITPKSGNTNCTNSQTIVVKAENTAVTKVSFDNATEFNAKTFYTGSEIKPTKEDLGKLTFDVAYGEGKVVDTDSYEIVGYTNNVNASTKYTATNQIVADAYVNVKITDADFQGRTYAVPFVINPLEVKDAYVTVPKNISINKDLAKASEYNVPVTVVAKDVNGKNTKTLTADDYKVDYKFVTNKTDHAQGTNDLNNFIETTVTVTNTNYIYGTTNGKTKKAVSVDDTEIVASKLTDSMVIANPASYTYTGGAIVPTYYVYDSEKGIYLYKEGNVDEDKAEYREIEITDAVNVGTGKIKVEGIAPRYSGTATGTFTITPANTSDVKVVVEDEMYTGRQIHPRNYKLTLNGNDVTDQFKAVSWGENKNVGKGTVTFAAKEGNNNFTGSNVTAEFNIVGEKISSTIKVLDSKGVNVTDDYDLKLNDAEQITDGNAASFKFNGNEQKFAKVVLSAPTKVGDGRTTATVDDLEIKYVDNVCGKYIRGNYVNFGYVYAVAKEGSGFTGTETIVTADGTVIKGVVAKYAFGISSVEFTEKNVTISNGVYAGGLPVKPEILIQIGGSTLVEGKDYTVTYYKHGGSTPVTPTEVTDGKDYWADIKGINGYQGSHVTNEFNENNTSWGIDKQNFKACDIKVTNGVVTVMNGYIPVPVTEYTYTNNGDGTYTVTANKDSKNYTGSKTVTAEGQTPEEKPEAPMIVDVNVYGNKATVVLSGDSEGAIGYDYVIGARDCIDTKDYVKVNKNKLTTDTTFTYTQEGTYYAYCHAWKRDENGKKIFSEWSNPYIFSVSAITPDTPVITGYKVSGSTVTVTYTKAKNADGYDVVLGSEYATIADEKRPVKYGELVKKNINGNTVTATFKNVPAGTYYAGLHAFNRTSEDGKKVFSPWSNIKTIKVK